MRNIDVVENLLSDVASGSQSSFARLYELMSPRVFGLAVHLIADRALAEETTVKIFVVVWREAAQFDRTTGSGRTWILEIAHRLAVECLRTTAGSRVHDSRRDQRDRGRSRRAIVEERTLQFRLDRPADSASTDGAAQLEAVRLAYFDGLSQAEIAARTAVPIATVKSRMRDGLDHVRAETAVTRTSRDAA